MGITIKEMAMEVGISWSAVSQILKNRGRFAPETRRRVLEVAAKHGYRPNASARSLRQQQSKLIGVIFRNTPDHAFTNMLGFEYLLGMNHQFRIAEYDTVLIRAGDLFNDASPEPRVFREHLVDGTIIVSALPDPVIDRIAALSSRNVWLDGPVWNETCCLRRDEDAAGRMAAEKLIELGYHELAFISRDATRSIHYSHVEREAGAAKAARKAGVAFRVVNWPESNLADEVTCAEELTSSRAGLIGGSLPVTRRLLSHAASLGRCPGHHFGIVCCDDTNDSGTGWRNLARVGFDRYEMGGMAATMMLALLANPESPPASRKVAFPWIVGDTAWGPKTLDD